MATDSIIVKQEPLDLSETSKECDVQSVKMEDGQEPEYINIKVEIDPKSITQEDDEEQTEECASSWHEPVTSGALEPDFISVKEEPLDYDEEPTTSQSEQNDRTFFDKTFCATCCRHFATARTLKRHLSTCGKQKITCEETGCGRQFQKWDQLERHLQGHEAPSEKNYCHICARTFANFKRHMLTHAAKNFHCTFPKCSSEFFTSEQLEKHYRRHTDRPYPCDECEKRFRSSSNLRQHKRSHATEKPYGCTNCHRKFAFKSNLARHQTNNSCRRPTDEPIQCKICLKIFPKEFLLKSHLRRHETEKPFECDICKIKFKHKSTLMRHILMHNGLKPYPCPYCNKSFTHVGLLKPHLRVHTGEKPYQCPICQKLFAHKHNMERHTERHNRIKHLVCRICNKEFPKESRLKYHMRTHSNEKFFICHVCPKRFSHKQNILRHYERKHPNATYNGTDTDASVALKVWDTFKSEYGVSEPEVILG